MHRAVRVVLLAVIVVWATSSQNVADEPWRPIERRLPPPGIEISADARQKLESDLARVEEKHRETVGKLSGENAALAVDVEIYLKAVRYALEENEFFGKRDVQDAAELLKTAEQRLDALDAGNAPWASEHGLVVRGYRSAVDDSPQPYGLVISEKLDLGKPLPLYVWLHGRGDKLADLQFIAQRGRDAGQIRPDDAIVLHPFGRSCLGWKSAAEIDVLEAIDSVASRYPVDRDRIVLMGFSMGGAGAWHIGAHYAERFAAVHAGAGFVDVARYQRLKPEQYPRAVEQTLWGLYDVPGYVRNLFNLPVVAYSGEVDKQKDAADFMSEVFQREGHELPHLIGPKMGHKYDPKVLAEVMRRMHEAAVQGRNTKPLTVSLQTRTLRYNRVHWVEALELSRHWQDSRIDASLSDDGRLTVTTNNVAALRLRSPHMPREVVIDGQQVTIAGDVLAYYRDGETWHAGDRPASDVLRKRPGLQGPIDDAFLEPFAVVVPTGKTAPQIERWVSFEIDHFLRRWRNVFRGEPRVIRDVDVTPDDCRQFHLLVWGDPRSNSFLRELAPGLPVRWSANELIAADRRVDADSHVPLLIYPNPKNPAKYVVLNSGPTFREAHDRTNSLQNPKLGDWALVDVRVAPNAERPGEVVAAGFFGDEWQWPAEVSAAETKPRPANSQQD